MNDYSEDLKRKAALAIFGGSILPDNWETDSRLPRVLQLIEAETLQARIDELKRAKRNHYITMPVMHRTDRRIEALEAELKSKKETKESHS